MPTILLRNTLTADQRARVLARGDCTLLDWADYQRDPSCAASVEILYGAPTPELLAHARRLAWVQLISAGYDHILTPDFLCLRPLPRLSHARGLHEVPVSEHVFALLLAHVRHLPLALRDQAAGRWRQPGDFPPFQPLEDRTLGILGLGAIGAQVAHVARALRMRVIGHNRSGAGAGGDVERVYGAAERSAFFAASDVLVNILPLTEATHDSMGAAEFAALPPGAIFINVGRGATVQTGALLTALDSGRLAAALLDVTDPEPLPAESPLWHHPRVLITPHLGGHSVRNEERGGEQFTENLGRYLAGEPLDGEVDLSPYIG